MKKQSSNKLSLEKVTITKLNKSLSNIMGGQLQDRKISTINIFDDLTL